VADPIKELAGMINDSVSRRGHFLFSGGTMIPILARICGVVPVPALPSRAIAMRGEKQAMGLLRLITGRSQAAIRAETHATLDEVAQLFKEARDSGEWSMCFSLVHGESRYQQALASSWEGQAVALQPEPDNLDDPGAIAVIAADKIGYIPRDSRFHERFPELQKHPQRIIARVLSISGGTDDKPALDAVLEIGIEKPGQPSLR
jgi:hypothetical protein